MICLLVHIRVFCLSACRCPSAFVHVSHFSPLSPYRFISPVLSPSSFFLLPLSLPSTPFHPKFSHSSISRPFFIHPSIFLSLLIHLILYLLFTFYLSLSLPLITQSSFSLIFCTLRPHFSPLLSPSPSFLTHLLGVSDKSGTALTKAMAAIVSSIPEAISIMPLEIAKVTNSSSTIFF